MSSVAACGYLCPAVALDFYWDQQQMNDFTSSLYLGFRHAKADLPNWQKLTDGKPAALNEPLLARHLGRTLAQLQGQEDGLLGPSSLHLFWDFFGLLDPKKYVLFVDALLYPVGLSGVQRAASNGMQSMQFRHLSSAHLRTLLAKVKLGRKRPIIVTDGWCPRCGKPAPLPTYQRLIEPLGGILIIDDTQSLGVLGSRMNSMCPYGLGGGGILRWWNLTGSNVITISSLAKGFGVPAAALCGAVPWIKKFRVGSITRSSNSPLSNAHLGAVKRALELNELKGDARRSSLLTKVKGFRKSVGRATKGGVFPVQTLNFSDRKNAISLYQQLTQRGFQTVLVGPHGSKQLALMILLRADHSPKEIWRLAEALQDFLVRKPYYAIQKR